MVLTRACPFVLLGSGFCFFQAEDGIRDYKVTGVRRVLFRSLAWVQAVFYSMGAAVIGIIAHSAYKLTRNSIGPRPAALRSEERRVGREWRPGWPQRRTNKKHGAVPSESTLTSRHSAALHGCA